LAVRDRESHHVSLGGEWLENRAMMAAFTYVGSTLTIDLENSNEAITLTIGGGGTTAIDKVFAQGDILVNDWASATATLLVSGTPKNTSPFALGRKVV
jgi:hypothetical protein